MFSERELILIASIVCAMHAYYVYRFYLMSTTASTATRSVLYYYS